MERFRRSPVVLGWICLAVAAASAGTGPILRLSAREVDFGRVDQYQQVHQKVMLRNEGDAPLKILKVVADCGCTAGVPSDSIVMPGQEVKLDVAFSTRNYKGSQKKNITIQTNDPAEPRAIIRVLADVHPFVRLSEETVRFPTMKRGETAAARVRIASDKGLKLEVVGIEGGEKYLTTSVEPVPSKEEDAFWINLKIRPDAPAGPFREAIRIHTTGPPTEKLSILAIGTIVSYFVLEGDIRIRMPVTPAGKMTEATLRITCDGTKPYRLTGIESPVAFLTGTITPNDANTFTVTLTVTETAPAGRYQETVLLKTTDPDQPVIELSVMGQVRS